MDTDNEPSDEMYDQFLRNTTNRLQDDLRTEMRTYNFEKERLNHHLSHLHPPPASPASTAAQSSIGISAGSISSQRKHKYYKAPNMARNLSSDGTPSETSSTTNSNPDQKWKERKEWGEKMKKERDLLKLPVIHSASAKRSEWDTGKYQQTSKPRMLSGIEPLPGISAARAFLSQSMKIPSIHDPQRTDTAFNVKSKKELKKVTFADENHKSLLSINNIDTSDEVNTKRDSKNSERKGPVPRLNLTANKFSHVSRPIRPPRTSLLPQLNITASEVRKNPQRITEGVNQWKTMYSSIMDPEQKMRALSDIMLAVRLKKCENELAMKYGDGPRPTDEDPEGNSPLPGASYRIKYRDECGHIYAGSIPTPRSSPRLGVGFPNTAQLQNYLRHMSRSRRALDKLYPRNYGNSQSEQTPTPVSVQA